MKPYKETENGNIIRRTFSDNVPESELVWHRDHEDRVVLPLNENDWMVQFDNELPTKLTVGEEYFIPKDTFHRVIKGSGELQVEIIKTDFDEVIEEGEKKKKRDACYHKVRARYDVWPSAYASGALVKCRKVGAANWGNKSNEAEEPSSKSINEGVGEINRFVKEYIKNTNFDIENSLGNCSFFTKDVVLWARKNGYSYDQSQYVYMPMSEKYRKQNNIPDSEWEDHIVPIINGYIIDFTYTPQGVSKKVRTSNTIPPAIFKFNESLFKPSGAYGKFGYTKPEINHVYGKRVGLSTFDTEEPKPKDTPNNQMKLAKRQFAKDLKNDPDYINYVQNSKDYGSVNATSRDPFIKKSKYTRFGKEELDELTVYEAKKTDFSKEKSQGLHGWFSRKGGEGSSGWVDCNTCRKDPDTGRKKCKPCGRQEGEKRKYPACRPTPSSCGTRGKGKKWGKKSTSENLNVSENFSIFDENYIKMKLQETFNHEEPLVLPAEPKTKPKESPMIQPSRRNKPFLPERETQPDPKAKN